MYDRAYLQKLDESEAKRTRGITNNWYRKGGAVDEIFRSEEVRDRVRKGSTALLSGAYDIQKVSLTLPFYDFTMPEVCDSCPCVTKPELILPLLENDLAIPILTSRYSTYPRKWISNLLKYPHISSAEGYSLRVAASIERSRQGGGICQHCVDRIVRESNKNLRGYDKETQRYYKLGLEGLVMPSLAPFLGREAMLLDDAASSIRVNDKARFQQVLSMAEAVGQFRLSRSLGSVPQVPMEMMNAVGDIEAKYPALGIPYDDAGVRQAVEEGLNIAYDPGLSLEKYLDIIVPRRSQISSLVAEISLEAKGAKGLLKVQQEVEEINTEIRRVSRSSRSNVLEFSTNLFSGNRGLIARCLAGAALGFNFGGPLGAAIGSSVGVTSHFANKIELPSSGLKPSKKLIEILEPGYHKVLAYLLSTDVKYVQLWSLQKKLGKTR